MRFGRRKAVAAAAGPEAEQTEAVAETDPRSVGPFDVSEIEIDEDDDSRVDLGSLLLTPAPGLDLQLQVDEASQQVIAVVLAGELGAAELRVFASPRNGDIWEGVRRSMAGEVAQLGGTATEQDGAYGPELAVSMTVQLEDGRRVAQQSRVIGVVGPRWLLRATLFGRPAVEWDPEGDIESAVRAVVVVRGSSPVPPGDALPLTMPPNARPAAPQQG